MIDNPTGRPRRRGAREVHRQALSRVPHHLDLLHVHEHRGAAVRQARRAPGGQLGARLRRAQPHAGRLPVQDARDPAAAAPGLRAQPEPLPRAQSAEGPAADRAGRREGRAGDRVGRTTRTRRRRPWPTTPTCSTRSASRPSSRPSPRETTSPTVGDRSLRAQTGFANWSEDYPHPADFIDVLLNPDNVIATEQQQLLLQRLQHGLRQAHQRGRGPAAQHRRPRRSGPRWTATPSSRPTGASTRTRKQSTFFSDRMNFQNCKGDDWPVATHDWARFCLK